MGAHDSHHRTDNPPYLCTMLLLNSVSGLAETAPVESLSCQCSNRRESANVALQTGFTIEIANKRCEYWKSCGAMPCDVILISPPPSKHAEVSTVPPLPLKHPSAAQQVPDEVIIAKGELMRNTGGDTCARQDLIWLDQDQKIRENYN